MHESKPKIPLEWAVVLPLLMDNIGGLEVEVGLSLLELPAEGAKPAGLILQPLIPSQIGTRLDLTENLRLELRAGTDIASTFGVLLRPGEIAVSYPFQPSTQLPSAGFGVELAYKPDTTTVLLGAPSASRLQKGGMKARLQVNTHGVDFELRLDLVVEDLALILAAGEQDGFPSSLLGHADVTVPIPLVIEWSSKTGLHFAGSADFSVAVHPDLRLGPISIDELRLGVYSTRDSGRPARSRD